MEIVWSWRTQQAQQPQQQHNVRTIMERKEEWSMYTNTPWMSDTYMLTKDIYNELRQAHFIANRNLLTDALIIKYPCREADASIRTAIGTIPTHATEYEWPVEIPSSTHITNQHQTANWYRSQFDKYCLGLYPHSHILHPITVNYGYLFHLQFRARATPISLGLFEDYGPLPAQPDTIELRTLEAFSAERKPLWVFTQFQTMPENRLPELGSHSTACVRVTRRIFWKEDTMEDRLEQLELSNRPSSSSSETDMDWEAFSPRSNRF